jgi:hypothetical protein
MTLHDVSIDLTVEETTDDHAYRAFCETCDWADPDGWHHSDSYGWPADYEHAINRAYADANVARLLHQAEQRAAQDSDAALDPPDVSRFLALEIPAADANGYAAYVASDSDEPGWADRRQEVP